MTRPVEAAVVTERQVARSPIARFELDTWRSQGLRAGVTGRAGNADLGLFADGRAGAVLENWLAFEASQRPEFRALAVGRQVHGAKLHFHPGPASGWQVVSETDGHLTRTRGLLLTITIADCIPVYLAHPASQAVALLHAGWRGTAAGILEKGIKELVRLASCKPNAIIMHCGVGVCGDCYEVGPEVIAQVTGRSSTGPARLDLRAALAERAARAGVEEITVSSLCSSHDLDRFFSHRRSRGSDGRMLAYLGVPEAPG